MINILISSLLRYWKEVSGVTSTVLSNSLNLMVDRNLALIFDDLIFEILSEFICQLNL